MDMVDIKKYKELNDLLESYWGCPIGEIAKSNIGGETDGGGEIEIPFAVMAESIRIYGIYGFAEKATNTIHLWIDQAKATDETVIALLGHELGHLCGEQCEDDIEEERRAELFSLVAVESFKLLHVVKL